MYRDGKYIYCIIASEYDCNFGPIGVKISLPIKR